MKIAIVGGEGTLGRLIAQELRQRQQEVRILGRRSKEFRVDLTTGDGLAQALSGCDVVINASNDSSKSAAQTLLNGSMSLLSAAQAAQLRHHICISVVGCEQVPAGYFRLKSEQERLTRAAPVPWTLVRATQFHEFLQSTLSSLSTWGLLPLPRVPLQPVAAIEVARAITSLAEGPPLRDQINIAGPEIADLRDFGREWRSKSPRHPFIIPLPLPGQLGRALRAGKLTCPHPHIHGKIRFRDALTPSTAL